MQNPLTPWTAAAQADLVNSLLIYETEMSQYALQIFNAGDSIWMKASWPKTGSIAFRLAFGMNSDFENVAVSEDNNELILTAPARLGSYTIKLSFTESLSLVRYTTSGGFSISDTLLASRYCASYPIAFESPSIKY
jgi:hypothetical protein